MSIIHIGSVIETLFPNQEHVYNSALPRGPVKYDIVHMRDQKSTEKGGVLWQRASDARDAFRGPKSPYLRN